MKFFLIFSLVFFGLNTFSQDINKMLQANKWYSKYDTKTMKIVYSKKVVSGSHETFEFKENGKVFWCGTVEESSLDAIGVEKQSTDCSFCVTGASFLSGNNCGLVDAGLFPCCGILLCCAPWLTFWRSHHPAECAVYAEYKPWRRRYRGRRQRQQRR